MIILDLRYVDEHLRFSLSCRQSQARQQLFVYVGFDAVTIRAHDVATVRVQPRSGVSFEQSPAGLVSVQLREGDLGYWSNQLKTDCRWFPDRPFATLRSAFALNFKVLHLHISNTSYIEINGESKTQEGWKMRRV